MIANPVNTTVSSNKIGARTIRPIAVSTINGMITRGDYLIAIDSNHGYLLEIDPKSDNTVILNTEYCTEFVHTTGITVIGDTLWFAKDECIYNCTLESLKQPNWKPALFATLPDVIDGLGFWESTIYATSQKGGKIYVYSSTTGKQVTFFYPPGIGVENLAVTAEELWVSDDLEQTVFCLDRATGQVKFSLLTPFTNPTGITFYPEPETGNEILYIAYANRPPIIMEVPTAEPPHEITYRDETFIHPLYWHYNLDQKYTLSNGFLVEMSYVEEIAPLETVDLHNLEWRIALPVETDRQKIKKIEWVGVPFTTEIEEEQPVAVFKFERLKPNTRYIFGWKVLLEVWSIKYQLTPKDCEKLPPLSPEFQKLYLLDDDDLTMDTPLIQRAAKESIQRETNILRKVHQIREYVYDKLSYSMKPHIDTPEIALERGTGSCGEYLGILLALSRLNGIACRTVGRYKCPQHPHVFGMPQEPDYNHVWMEFYLPGIGWLPMESNPDDISDEGPYPNRFFMGLAWFHAEMGKKIPFEIIRQNGQKIDKTQVSIGDLAINHVRFTLLEELAPTGVES